MNYTPVTNNREYNETQLNFRQNWIDAVLDKMDDHSDSLTSFIAETFDNTFEDNVIELYNSVYNETYKTSTSNYYMFIKEKHIINENGVLTYKHSVKSSPIEDTISGGILGRQVQKKKKQKYIKEGHYMEADTAAIFEYTLKVLINGLYGLHLYPGSPFFNVTLGATCTAAARNMVAVAAIVIELIEGGFRNYQVQAHLKMIEVCKRLSKDICSKYELIDDFEIEDVLKVLLGDYYEGYYAKTFLRHQLEKCDRDTLKLLYIKNNVYAFMELPRVKEIFTELMRIQRENPTSYLANPKSDPLYKDLMSELYSMSADILYGFYFYDGDYDGKTGVYYDTLVDIIENIKRKKIVLMDTDSCVSTFQRETTYFLEKYKGQYDETDYHITDGVIPSIICWIYMGCIAKSLTDYVMELGVSLEYAKKVEMEMEHMMSQLQLSLAKKSYVFIPVITDFFMNAHLKLKLKGVSLIKSNFNQEFCQMGVNILKDYIMQPIDKINHKSILFRIKESSAKAVSILRSDDFILNKRTMLKINSETLSFSEHKMKSVNLWNSLYPERQIEIPGSFGVVLLSLDEDKLFELKNLLPKEYKIINEFSLKVARYKELISAYKKIIKNSYSFDDPMLRRVYSTLKTDITGREHLYNEELYRNIYEIYESLNEKSQSEFRRVFGFIPTMNEEALISDILDSCKKIAIPIDQNEVPELLKFNKYSIIDISASSEVEHTISPLTSTIGFIFSKNKDKRNTITSILNTF